MGEHCCTVHTGKIKFQAAVIQGYILYWEGKVTMTLLDKKFVDKYLRQIGTIFEHALSCKSGTQRYCCGELQVGSETITFGPVYIQ